MNKEIFNIKLIIALVVFMFFTLITYEFAFDVALNAYQRGYRYWVLKVQLVVVPLFYIISVSHIILKITRKKVVEWSILKLILKYFGILILLLIAFFVLGMIFNDITSKGANINF